MSVQRVYSELSRILRTIESQRMRNVKLKGSLSNDDDDAENNAL